MSRTELLNTARFLNRKAISHATLFLATSIGSHFVFSILDLSIRFVSLLLVPIIFAFYHFTRSLLSINSKQPDNAVGSVLIGLLFCLISLKLHYVYYNVALSVILLSLAIIGLCNLSSILHFTEMQDTICLILVLINIILLFTPDTALLNYYNYRKKTWTPDLSWEYFKGKPDSESLHVAVIATRMKWKVNRAYNYPPAIVSALIIPDSSWKKDNTGVWNESSVLQHEQGHANITELYKRESIDSIKALWGQKAYKIEQVIRFFSQECNKYQEKYDRQTLHGQNLITQQYWTEMINRKLGKQLP